MYVKNKGSIKLSLEGFSASPSKGLNSMLGKLCISFCKVSRAITKLSSQDCLRTLGNWSPIPDQSA